MTKAQLDFQLEVSRHIESIVEGRAIEIVTNIPELAELYRDVVKTEGSDCRIILEA